MKLNLNGIVKPNATFCNVTNGLLSVADMDINYILVVFAETNESSNIVIYYKKLVNWLN